MLKTELSYTSAKLLIFIQRMGIDTLKKILHSRSDCDIAQRLSCEVGTLCVHEVLSDTQVNANET